MFRKMDSSSTKFELSVEWKEDIQRPKLKFDEMVILESDSQPFKNLKPCKQKQRTSLCIWLITKLRKIPLVKMSLG